MAEELTGELISKWINFKLYSESVEGPFFSPSVLVYFKPVDFLYHGLEPVKKFLKDFFNQGSSDCQIEIVASKMDIQGVILVENLKIAITSKLPTVEWLFGKDVNYCNLTGKRVVLNTVMSIQFTNELLDKVIIDWDPKELEECLLPEASQEEVSANVEEKNDTVVSGSAAETVETKPVEEQKAELEEPVTQAEPANNKEDAITEGKSSESKEEPIIKETPSDNKEETVVEETPDNKKEVIQNEPSEVKADSINVADNSAATGVSPGSDNLPNNESQDKQEAAVSTERDTSQNQENEKAEVDTLVDSEGSAKSRSPAPTKNAKARVNSAKTHSKNSSSNPKVKPSPKSSTSTKTQSESSPKPVSRSNSQQPKPVDSSKSSFQAKPPVPRSGMSRTMSQTSVKTTASAPRVVRRPGSQASHLSSRSFSNSSSTRPKSAIMSSSERLSFLEFRPTSVGPSSRPLIRSSPAARNLVTSFSLSGEPTSSQGTPALQDNAWAKSLRPYLNKGSTGVRL